MIKNDTDTIRPQEETLNGIYRGVVEDNNDTEKAGRCRIRVFGVHTEYKGKDDIDGVPTEHLPWAEPAFSLFEGSVSGYGSWTVPLQGSHVFLFFEAGHILQPRYFASAPGIPKEGPDDNEGFSDPDGKYPETEVNAPHNPHSLNEPDFHRLGRNEGISDTIVQSKSNNKINGVPTADGNTWDEPDPYYSAQYPNNKVFASNSGITIEIDDTSGEERIHIYHPSSSYTEINKDGSMVIRNKLDKFQIVDGDNKILIQKNRTKTVYENEEEYTSKNKTEYVGGEKDETVDKDKSTQINANWSVSITGTTIIESDGTTTVNGSDVYLNNGSGRGPAGKIVTMNHICQVTGLPHNNGSSTCYAEF